MTDSVATQPLYSGQSAQKSNTASSQSGDEAVPSKPVLSSDFETFLKMLTVQMQNQDPLNPVESTEYATQLATFSSVEQQVQTNDLLKAMQTSLGGGKLQEYGSWIGMEGLVRGPTQFSGSPITVRPSYAEGAESAKLMVKDADGKQVETFPLTVGQESVLWGGYKPDGSKYDSGAYVFEVESYKGGKVIDTQTAQVYSGISEVRLAGSGTVIRLSDGSEVTPDKVSGIRAPQAA